MERQSIIEAREHKNEITEELLNCLTDVANNIDNYAKNTDYVLHFYALFLLAEFREKRAFPLIIKLISQDSHSVHFLLGDIISEGLDRILASTFDGNIDALYGIIADTSIDEFIRESAFSAVRILGFYDVVNPKDVMIKIEKLLDNGLKDDSTFVVVNFAMRFFSPSPYLIDKIND